MSDAESAASTDPELGEPPGAEAGSGGEQPPVGEPTAADAGPSALSSASGPGDEPRLFRELDRRGKALRALAIVFTLYHLGALLTGGAVSEVRKRLAPVFGIYGETLRMTNSWGMFGKPPQTTNVTIETSTREQRSIVIATTRSADRDTWERIRDVRLRKIGAKLADDGDRSRFGGQLLDYFCQNPPAHAPKPLRYLRVVNHLHELRDDEGRVTREASTRVLLTRRCPEPGAKREAPPPPPPAANQEGGEL